MVVPADLRRRRVVGDGVTLSVHECGDRSATTVVLVHGFPDDGSIWAGVAAALAPHHHVVVPDVRGAGDSDAPSSRAGYRLEHLARDLRAVVDATSPGRPVHLVGHDWGSVQSWEAVTGGALDGRVASFTSLSGPSLDHLGVWLRRAPLSARLRQATKSWYVAAFHLPFAAVPWRRGLARRWPAVLARMEDLDPALLTRSPAQARNGADGVELYRANVRSRLRAPRPRTTDVPVQLVVAEQDRFVSPAMADAALPHCAELVRRVEPVGHWALLVERPDRFAELIATFVDQVETANGA